MRATALPLGLPPEQLRAAVLDVGAADSPDIALWLAAGVAPREAPDLRAPDLVLAWGGAPGARAAARRRDELARGLAACRFRDAAWFPALAAALDAAYDPAAGVAEAPGAGPAAGARGGALMPLARTPLLDALVAPLRFPWLELSDRRAGRRLRPVQDRTAAIGPSDILLVTCLRNERARMPAFADHYRRLGVGHFLVVDNDSTDGFMDWAREQPDVSVWHTKASYRDSRFGMLWVNDLLRRHGRKRWCVVVDPDEFLVYP